MEVRSGQGGDIYIAGSLQVCHYGELATITTNFGNIELEFYPQDAPKTVENFKQLGKRGLKIKGVNMSGVSMFSPQNANTQCRCEARSPQVAPSLLTQIRDT